MSKEQILNILLLSLIFTLIFQFFLPKNSEKVLAPWVALLTDSKNTTIPNIPHVRVLNNTTGNYDFHTCEDMTLRLNSQQITFSGTKYSDFCRQVHIAPQGWYYLPFLSLSEIFEKKPGEYTIQLGSAANGPIVTINHAEPGFFRSFFWKVFFEPIYNLFVALLAYIPWHSLGFAIIIITLIIRFILVVPQKQMLVSQKKLQKIQPKIKKIQEDFKWDQARIGQEMMALYKKEHVNPMGSCLPLLIQMPILIWLYWVISSIGDITNHYYLYSWLEWFNLSRIDPVFYWINLKEIGGTIGIVFAVILWFVQWIQAKLSFAMTQPHHSSKVIEPTENGNYKPADSMMPDPAMMQKMMLYFIPVVVGISAIVLPLGVGLYWLIGTLFVIVQQWILNKEKVI